MSACRGLLSRALDDTIAERSARPWNTFLTLTFMKYQMTCTCGQVMAVDADSRDAAVAQLKELIESLPTHNAHLLDFLISFCV